MFYSGRTTRKIKMYISTECLPSVDQDAIGTRMCSGHILRFEQPPCSSLPGGWTVGLVTNL